jgi:hypothetical protein
MAEDTKYARGTHHLRVKKNPVIQHPRRCDKPGCENGGEFRAPKSRQTLRDYYWFCLDHVREYNQAWDFFKDMKPDQIEAYQRATLVGLRPTWKLGMQGQPEAPNAKLKFFFKGAFVQPADAFDLQFSTEAIVITMLGGQGTILGPALGAYLYEELRGWLLTSQTFSSFQLVIAGVLLLVIVLFAPGGLMGMLYRRWPRLKRVLE